MSSQILGSGVGRGPRGAPGADGAPGLPGVNAVPADEAVAVYLATEGTETKAALDSGYQPTLTASPSAITRRTLAVAGRDFYAKGVNLGSQSTWPLFWTTEYDLASFADSMTKAAAAGFNSVRIVGSFTKWLADPTTTGARMVALINAAKDNQLKVIFDFLNPSSGEELIHWGTYETGYKAYVDALLDEFGSSDIILAWSAGNEFNIEDADALEVAEELLTYVKAQSPSDLVCATQAVFTIDEALADMAILDSLVDFHALNWYMNPTTESAGVNALTRIMAATNKPVMITEIGVGSGTTGGSPIIGNSDLQAEQIRNFARQTVWADLAGVMFWKARDYPGNTTKMGLWDDSNQPKRVLDAAASYPAARISMPIREALLAGPVVTLIDNFDRDASATVLGGPELGAAGTTVTASSVIGIHSEGGAYFSTRNGSTSDKHIYTLPARKTPLFDVEYYAQNNQQDLVLLYNYTDTSNWNAIRLLRNTGDSTQIDATMLKLVAGSLTTVSTYAFPGAGQADFPRRWRLSVALGATRARCFVNGVLIGELTHASSNPLTAKRGFGISQADAGSRVLAVRNFTEGRISP